RAVEMAMSASRCNSVAGHIACLTGSTAKAKYGKIPRFVTPTARKARHDRSLRPHPDCAGVFGRFECQPRIYWPVHEVSLKTPKPISASGGIEWRLVCPKFAPDITRARAIHHTTEAQLFAIKVRCLRTHLWHPS